MKQITKQRRWQREDLVFSVGFIVLALFLLLKCRYGIGNSDESFYLTIPYRMMKGDVLFLHEWHPSQMAAFLQLPFMKMYLAVTKGNTTGIILTFRLIYVACQLVTVQVLYHCLKRYSRIGAGLGALFLGIYAPFGMMALSYNSMAIMLLAVGCALLLTARRPIVGLPAGLALAGAVLCCPHLVVLYVIYAVAVLIGWLRKREKKAVATFLFVTLGCGLSAAAVMGWLLSRMNLETFLVSLKWVLTDPEHKGGIAKKMVDLVGLIFKPEGNPVVPFVWAVVIVAMIVGAVSRRMKVKEAAFAVTLLAAAVHLVSVIVVYRYPNFLMLPLCLPALASFVIFRMPLVKRLFVLGWIPGMVYAMCIHFSSNQRLYAISSAATVALVFSVVILFVTVRELLEMLRGHRCGSERQSSVGAVGRAAASAYAVVANNTAAGKSAECGVVADDTAAEDAVLRKAMPCGNSEGIGCPYIVRGIAVLLIVLMVVQAGSELGIRWHHVYWEESVHTQTERLTEGPQKGIFVAPDKVALYEGARATVAAIPAEDKVLWLTWNCWLPLCGPWQNASLSAWCSKVKKSALTRQSAYYEINPDKWPDWVWIDARYGDWVEDVGELFDCEVYQVTEQGVLMRSLGKK
ncbi:MAG: hypothetical protein Q4B73_08120 [Lachnospiraceae bacterium]|nr:hypothetical protein [Lachnospiraceae bacterium]